MASSDDEHSQQKREREALGDEIERMRELLGKDFPNLDEESSGEEDVIQDTISVQMLGFVK